MNEHFTRRIVELSADESDLLLGHLTRWVQDPRFTVRRSWTEGTVALWDNRATQHYACSDYWPAPRVMERAAIAGDRPR